MSGADTVRGLVAAMEAQDWEGMAEYLSEDFVITGPYPQPEDKQEFIAIQQAVKAAFPDWEYTLADIREDGNKVMLMLGSSGTQTGVFTVPGVGSIPPSGRRVTLPPSPAEYTLRGGKVAALHVAPVPGAGMDGALEQLGLNTK
jgi:predicted ester cyclase